MPPPDGWSDPRLRELLDRLCQHARLNPLVQSRVDTDDVRQEVGARILKAPPADMLGKPVEVWMKYLREVFDSVVTDLHRKHLLAGKRSAGQEVREEAFGKGHSPESAPDLGQVLRSPDTTPSQRVVKTEELDLMRAAIERLPREQKLAIEYQLLGMGPSQIALKLGKSPDSVQSLLFRATLALKSMMNPPGREVLHG